MDTDTQPTPAAVADATTEGQAPPADAQTPAAADAQPQAPAYDWRRALDEAPTEEIRRHPKFAGIVGSEKQFWQQDYEARKKAEDDEAAMVRVREEMRQKAKSNPVAFADEWLNEDEAKEQHERVEKLEINARQAIGRQVGAAFHAIPEWAEIASDPEALAHLATTMQGKGADEVIPAWNAAAVELVANRRAKALLERQLQERIQQERAAWETEAAARGFATSARPDLVRGGAASSADPEPDFRREPAAWNAWWERNK